MPARRDSSVRWLPDPFVLVVLLTVLAFAWALLRGHGFGELVDAWAGERGFAGLLRFAMQMSLVLVTGHALAAAPAVQRGLQALAARQRRPRQAVWFVGTLAAVAGLVHWGLGVIAGAVLARDTAAALQRRGVAVPRGLLAAAGYLGMLVWHGGLSGSAPLKVTRQEDLREVLGAGTAVAPIGLDQTLGSGLNLFVTLGLVVLAPLLLAALCPRGGDEAAPPMHIDAPTRTPVVHEPRTAVVRWLEDSRAVNLLLAALVLVWAVRFYGPGGAGLLRLSPDALNLTMLGLGLALHPHPRSYLAAVEAGARACSGILLQFPLYGGILGVMQQGGLTAAMAQSLAATADPRLLPLLTFGAACVVNLFVPSGGGQWAVQGPIALQSGLAAGVAPATMVMAVAYGDQTTNMLQPFWALPLLAITGCRAGELLRYSAMVMLLAMLWIGLGLWCFG